MDLRIEHLSKVYANGVRALDDVSLTIPEGMFGLLGPNGAGKSTLMRIIATLLDPDSGTIHLGDLDVLREHQELRKVLGYLPQEFGVYPHTTAQEMLDHLALLKGMVNTKQRKEAVAALLNRTNLYPHRNQALTGFSGGMRQRFGIAQALLGNPRLLIVDEPTAGLDPSERNRLYNLLSELSEKVIVILSTHIVQDVMELCSNMAIIHLGKVLFAGSPDMAVKSLDGCIWQKSITKDELTGYAQRFRVISNRLVGGRPLIHVYSAEPPGDGFAQVSPDLEDVFFSRVGSIE
ncbi:MAG: ABC transporter ATP-binding protein [Candidatus Binataceae bacterium]